MQDSGRANQPGTKVGKMKGGQNHSQNHYNGTLCRTYCGHVIPASLLTLPPVDSGNHCSHYKMSSRMPLYFVSLPQSQSPKEEHSRLCCPYSVAKLESGPATHSVHSGICFGQILIPNLALGEWDKNIFFFKEIFF